ncbi:MAG: metallophosphoesterase [Thermoanaerobaculales bacterium]|jgi:hypothetical protein|nr:metallophosphoesterase [Thermoanaerobaculales bacterium]
MQLRRHLVIAFIALALALPAAAGDAGRIVAVGDVHGSYDGLTAILREAGIVDEQLRWAGGTDTYVQLGDLLDRGVEVRKVLDLLIRLQGEAKRAGGRLECILGNHETMNLTGFFRDANPEVYAGFVDSRSEKRREKLWHGVKRYRELAGQPVDDAARDAWLAEHPPGWIEYVVAIGPDGEYGQWLRERPIAVMIDEVLFIHGGVGPAVAGRSVDEINHTARQELAVFDRVRHYLVAKGLVPPSAGYTEVGQMVLAILFEADKEDSTDQVRRHADQIRDLADIDDWLIMSPDGPLWFRGPSHWSEEEQGAEMAALLDGIGARVMVVGHTPDPEGRIRARFSNRVVIIDTGMLASYYEGGRPSALEISGGVFTAIYLGGEREVLPVGDALDRAVALAPIPGAQPDRAAAAH